MINFKNSSYSINEEYLKIKDSNLISLIKNKDDFNSLSFLNFQEEIISRVTKIFDEKKNTCFKFFYGKENFEEIILLFYFEENKDLYLFLGDNITNIPNNYTFQYNNDNILLDSLILGKYDFSFYKKEKKEYVVNIISNEENKNNLKTRLDTLQNIILTRNLVNTPSNDKNCDNYIDYIKTINFKNTKIKVIDYEEIKKLGLNLIEAVGRGSQSKPKLVILEKIVDKDFPTIGLVGKGIVFDSGGLNIKVDNHMYGMKIDMAGSASLLFTMKELDEVNLKCNLVCALAIAENSISGDSYRPGDIITSYSGKTVEIINTDAEGRLVLADAISYISKNYNLDSITTMATLTGACLLSLGYNYAGIMGDNNNLIKNLLSNGTFEKYWELPFNEFYIEKTKGNISDLKNLTEGIFVGATMGGSFLKNFCLNNEKFTHIDIAGVSFVKEKYGLYNTGATGFGVDSLSKTIVKLYN